LEIFNSYYCAKSGECVCSLSEDELFWLEKEREYIEKEAASAAGMHPNIHRDTDDTPDRKREEKIA